ncbi:hypothetical protein BHM03_00033653 [Ensete ventricosum]|nr:hypothetical protein BHM03_00033653 [Ensete ventricosum]
MLKLLEKMKKDEPRKRSEKPGAVKGRDGENPKPQTLQGSYDWIKPGEADIGRELGGRESRSSNRSRGFGGAEERRARATMSRRSAEERESALGLLAADSLSPAVRWLGVQFGVLVGTPSRGGMG